MFAAVDWNIDHNYSKADKVNFQLFTTYHTIASVSIHLHCSE